MRKDVERRRPAELPIDNLVLLDRVGSTNRLARRIVEDYTEQDLTAPQCLVVARQQREGRGRQGRDWRSPPGLGVYATRVVHRENADQCARLPLQVAVGLASALNEMLPHDGCRLKWPNDLVTDRGKLGGILIEVVSSPADGPKVALVGFGVNRSEAVDVAPAQGATCLERELEREPSSLGELVWTLTAAVEREIQADPRAGDLVERYRELSVHAPGRALRCRLGGETVEGIFRGFDDRGFLRLEQDGEIRTIASGEVLE